jgi:glycosyltransferase involved in cell wall biosynthesis
MKRRKNNVPLTISLLTHNRQEYLKLALDAISAQTYADFELMVLDNASEDGTPDVVMSHKDPRLTYIRQPPNCSPEYNAYSGSLYAHGERVMVTHDDDIMEPTLIEKEMAVMDSDPDVSIVMTNASVIDENGNLMEPELYPYSKDQIFRPGEYLGYYLLHKYAGPASVLMAKRDLFYPSAMVNAAIVHEDRIDQLTGRVPRRRPKPQRFTSGEVMFLCDINRYASVAYLSEPLLRYRMHPGQDSKNIHLAQPDIDLLLVLKRRAQEYRILRRHLPGIQANLMRFRAQDALIRDTTSRKHGIRIEIDSLRKKWMRSIVSGNRLHDAILSFELLVRYLDLPPTLVPGAIGKLSRLPATGDRAVLAYREWYKRLSEGKNLFSGTQRPHRVAILGSVMVAALLILEAQRLGTKVACCLDANPSRQGANLLGVPIRPHAWLRSNAGEIDMILLSSEKTSDGWLRPLINSYLGGRKVPIVSWKDLLC